MAVARDSRASTQLTNSTSKSRLAVDREFVYIGSVGLGLGGRAGGRPEGKIWEIYEKLRNLGKSQNF